MYKEAEKVFRDDLKKYPHNGRGLFGLCACLKAEGNLEDARKVEEEFESAWKNADTKLKMEDF